MAWTENLITGLAQYLAAGGVGVWRPTGVYTAGEVAIVYRAIPQTPDQVITLAAYPIGSTNPGLADHDTAVQVRIRGTADPLVCDALADAVFDLLDSATGLSFGGVRVPQMWRQSYTSLGQDTNNRWERSENYYLQTMRPTVHNTD